MDIDLFADIVAENDPPPGSAENDLLEETLDLTKDCWGWAQILDFTSVTGHPERPGRPTVEVTAEKVQDAALRFRGKRVTVLNFASGVSPGGGVRYGALAQEEALCLCSGLLHGLEAFAEFYEKNQEDDAPWECYDRMIWSEDVPLVRDGAYDRVEPMTVQVITYPAPNSHRAYVAHRHAPTYLETVRDVFRRRCRHVVRQASHAGTEVLVLGAWGCGEYGNDPAVVAEAFKEAVATQSGTIRHVVFACYGPAANRDAFTKAFA
jgi:uncharacterized protein (TIGR02452 family)